jgi:predicted HNH restriction endonuclease
MKKYTTEDYISTLRSLNIAPHHLKMLQAHYTAPEKTLTALQMAKEMESLGWTNEQQPIIPEEITETTRHYEGAVRSINVNVYERSTAARSKCILHYGCKCAVCEIILTDIYGDIAQGYIHVHHLRQLSEINAEYEVYPIDDLRPLCPNCHAIIHISNPPRTIEEIQTLIKEHKKNANKKINPSGNSVCGFFKCWLPRRVISVVIRQ